MTWGEAGRQQQEQGFDGCEQPAGSGRRHDLAEDVTGCCAMVAMHHGRRKVNRGDHYR
mgnify:FL=1